jgi:hypothetical protein
MTGIFKPLKSSSLSSMGEMREGAEAMTSAVRRIAEWRREGEAVVGWVD